MRVDALAVELRPRSMWEATDLGLRMAQANARALWRSVGPVYLVVVVLTLASVAYATVWPTLLIFWLKPWIDRSVLFVLARSVFGQDTRLADLWAARRTVWGGQWLSTLTWRRFSPWRSYTQPIYQLEGQRGSARRQRREQLLRQQHNAALGMHLAFAHIEFALMLGVTSLALWWSPDGSRQALWAQLVAQDHPLFPYLITLVYAAVVALLEPFYVAAGFAMYLNRRVQLEAWDVEQEFRRAF